ncbi:MAG: hypothetical protein K1Y36_14685 [Blastocatellia bacterium]|nr:hypothetical protein [Blastocatellia bacterium]
MVEHVLNLTIASLIVAVCFTLGNFFRRRLVAQAAAFHFLPFDFGLGAGLVAGIVFLAGICGFYRPELGWIAIGLGILCLGNPHLWSTGREVWKAHKPDTLVAWLACSLTVVALLFALLAGLPGPVADDALLYHLEIQRQYILQGRIIELPYQIYSYYPQGLEMLYGLGMLMHSDRVPALIHWFFGVFWLTATLNLGVLLRLRTTNRWLVLVLLASTPILWMEMGFAFVDLGWAFFVTLALGAVFLWNEHPHKGWLVVAGLCLGAGYGIKFSNVVFFPLVFLIFILIARQRIKSQSQGLPPIWHSILYLVIPVAFFPLPWLLRNVWFTGNPFFPFIWGIFPTHCPGWDAERTAQNIVFLHNHFGSKVKDWWDYLSLPWRVCVLADGHRLDLYCGETGFFYLGLFPSLLLWKHWSTTCKLLLIMVAGYFAFWAQATQQTRFLLPLAPMVLWSIFVPFETWLQSQPSRFIRLAVTTTGGLILAGTVLWNGCVIAERWQEFETWKLLTKQVTVETVLRDKYEEFQFYEFINANTPPQSRVFLVNVGNRTYHLHRDYFYDTLFEDFTLNQLTIQATSAENLRHLLRQRGLTHLLMAPALSLAPQFTPFAHETDRKRLQEFLNTRCRILKTSEHFVLFEIL